MVSPIVSNDQPKKGRMKERKKRKKEKKNKLKAHLFIFKNGHKNVYICVIIVVILYENYKKRLVPFYGSHERICTQIINLM